MGLCVFFCKRLILLVMNELF